MKKTLIFCAIVMLLIGYQLISICVAQDYSKWNLPEGAIARLGKGNINEITFSPDGTKFAVSTTIGVWIYSAENGKELALLKSDEIDIVSSVFTSNGKSLMIAAVNGETHLWNATTGEKLARLTDGNDFVEEVALSGDSSKLVTNSMDDKFRVYDLENPETDPLVIDDTFQSVKYLEFSTDGEIIAATKIPHHSQYGKVVENVRMQVWNTKTKNQLLNIPGEDPYITAMILLADGNTIVTADVDNQIQFWNIAAESVSQTFKVSEVGTTLAYAPKSRILASCQEKISLWNISSNKEQATLIRTLKGHERTITASAFSPDENTLVTASEDGIIIAWDVKTGNQQFSVSGHIGITQQLAFADTDDTLMSANSRAPWIGWDTDIHDWDLTKKKILSSNALEFIRTEAISPDCRTVIVEKENGDIDFLNIKSEKRQYSIKGFAKDKLNPNFTFSSNGKVIATNDMDGKIHVWKIPDLKQTSKPWKTLSLTEKQGWIRTLSADGNTLASVENRRIVRVWDVITGNSYLTFYDDMPTSSDSTKQITGLRFSPDGKTLVVSNEEEIHLWDTKTGEQIALCIPDRITWSMTFTFSPDSSILVSACRGTKLSLEVGELRTATGSSITEFVSENYGGTFQLWDARTGELLSTHSGHTNKINSLAFSSDGKTLATGGADGTILLWDWEKIASMR